jgi:hypothetical protein
MVLEAEDAKLQKEIRNVTLLGGKTHRRTVFDASV